VYKNTKVLTGVTNDEQLEEVMVVFSRHSSVQNVSSWNKFNSFQHLYFTFPVS